ncbi:AN1-like Zinc finger family protein [Candida parapsilosis]|uniref:Ubiquitin-like domain-containing protein n=2 Tax=Candida parapsilosis TaxID=5480 RepID=G8BDS6_CANPC|nr:uncharacterized protein CPAR2_210670 [Candida parapsilosis]KAF6054428.1 AN1-like Zinc finger family protein [Candida parapsilosis]KAF6056548.1 AN1-like Zinc finger family protein [Candida parapsilosis]KAF6059483.1 AN1-like Zinc finger family protein [Candida parapsilosis]KAF6068236.1 AN1-like Zinc finger family protein [Candida parapsilosis]KAI5904995.1 AN1-type zinc finger protein [Candida parapsilosis]
MKVTIRLSTESSFQVTIPDNSTVEDLRNSVKVASPSPLPKDFKLIFNGQKLQPHNEPLSSLDMKPENESIQVILMAQSTDTPPISPQVSSNNLASITSTSSSSTTSTAIKKTKKKNKCSFKSCNSAPLRMVGTCSHCQGKFCAKHRLLEDHMCIGLQYCKDDAHESNAMKLQNESTIASRV